ncbi:MAG: GNAT family N-acetyltransferase [Anaerolineae bacterium]
MAVIARSRARRFVGLRPMEPLQDLRGVADLIEEAFAHDLDRSGQNALRELRWLSYLKPILWWMVMFGSEHDDFLSGFVWEEEGKIVGNITVNRITPGSRRWLISNVAVDRSYRGRGIARGLMYAALELVKEYHATSVSLQVRADNEPARHLYESLDFKEISGTSYLRLKPAPPFRLPYFPPLPGEVKLRPHHFNSADARQAYQLAGAATPAEVQKEWPLRQSRFRLDSQEQFFSNFFHRLVGGGPAVHWVVENGQSFVATVNVKTGALGTPHQIELTVHPEWRGYLEKPLIGQALKYLQRWRNSPVLVKHPNEHGEALEAFHFFGFEHEQTLLWMKQDF